MSELFSLFKIAYNCAMSLNIINDKLKLISKVDLKCFVILKNFPTFWCYICAPTLGTF